MMAGKGNDFWLPGPCRLSDVYRRKQKQLVSNTSQSRKMSTTTLRETPFRTDTYSLNPDALEHVGAAESEKGMINVSKEATESLKSKVKGQIVLPTDSSYDEVRQIWNALIDRRPALIRQRVRGGHGHVRRARRQVSISASAFQ
jgi:hypothetical protein